MTLMEMTLGLDLGQSRDYSALVATERVHRFADPNGSSDRVEDVFMVGHTQRWRLGTPYTAMIEDVAELLRRPELDRCLLVFDRTGPSQSSTHCELRRRRRGRSCGRNADRPFGQRCPPEHRGGAALNRHQDHAGRRRA